MGKVKNANEKKGQTPLHTAVDDHDVETISRLLANGADIKKKDHEGKPPSWELLPKETRERVVSILLDKYKKTLPELYQIFKRDINDAHIDGTTLLYQASKHGVTDDVMDLLGAGANPFKTEETYKVFSQAVLNAIPKKARELWKRDNVIHPNLLSNEHQEDYIRAAMKGVGWKQQKDNAEKAAYPSNVWVEKVSGQLDRHGVVSTI